MYLHIGVAKTGTTYLQSILFGNRALLADAGVLYPGRDRRAAHFFASLDLRGTGFQGHRDEAVEGAWPALVQEVNAHRGRSAVISHETLARTPKRLVHEAVDAFDTDDVRVVVTARDLARQVPAVWQERLKNGNDQTYPDFLKEIFEAPQGRRRKGDFWTPQWLPGVVERWLGVVGPERVTVVTVPPRGAEPIELWHRFVEAVDLPDLPYRSPTAGANTSLGLVEAELLRRMNAGLADLDWPTYEKRVKHGFAERRLSAAPQSGRIVVPGRWHPAVEEVADTTVAWIASSGVRVVGDLEDLRPKLDADTPDEVPPVSDAELVSLATRVVTDFALEPPPTAPPPASLGLRIRRRFAGSPRLRGWYTKVRRG